MARTARWQPLVTVSRHLPSGRHALIDACLFGSGKSFRLDLSHGTNLLPTSPPISDALAALDDRSDDVLLYGEPIGGVRFRAGVASYLRASVGGQFGSENVIVTAGAREALSLTYRALNDLLSCRSVLVVGPQFPAVHVAILGAGLRLRELLGTDDEDYEPSVDEICGNIGNSQSPEVIHLTVPGNPSGRLRSEEELALILTAAAHSGAFVVLDAVCSDIPSSYLRRNPRVVEVAERLSVDSRVVVVDSFSKRRSLAGLRIGYLATRSAAVIRWIANRIFGGTQPCIGLKGLLADLEASTAHLEGTPSVRGGEKVVAAVAHNHRTMVSNYEVAASVLGSHLQGLSHFDAGQNVVARLDLPARVTDIDLVNHLVDAGVGSYPMSCFLARRRPPAAAMHAVRVTLSTPQAEFQEACEVAAAALPRI